MSGKYIFWLAYSSFPFYMKVNKKAILCTIDQNKIQTTEPIANNTPALDIDISTVTNVKIVYTAHSLNSAMELQVNKTKTILLSPLNPFDPTFFSCHNSDEVTAMLNIIRAFSEGKEPDSDSNPYLRQLQQKNKPSYIEKITSEVWDSSISPWVYYYKYVPQNIERARKIVYLVVNIVLAVMIITAIIAIIKQWLW